MWGRAAGLNNVMLLRLTGPLTAESCLTVSAGGMGCVSCPGMGCTLGISNMDLSPSRLLPGVLTRSRLTLPPVLDGLTLDGLTLKPDFSRSRPQRSEQMSFSIMMSWLKPVE